jgi:osmotically-inducible protein OsmY
MDCSIRRPRHDVRHVANAVAVVAAMTVMTFAGAAGAAAGQGGSVTTDADMKAAVMKQISSLDYGGQRPTVAVTGGVISLSGTVYSLWLKEETINRALKVPGRTSLESDLMIVKAESDAKLAAEVIKRISGFDRLSPVYDDIQGSVKNGIVHLLGAMTDEKNLGDLVERIAKVRGVQAIDNKVTVLPASRSDDQLRVAIANAIYRNPEFENYSRVNPPIHVIVNNGYVTLTGIVRSDLEKIKAHESAANVFGILKIDDRVNLPDVIRLTDVTASAHL